MENSIDFNDTSKLPPQANCKKNYTYDDKGNAERFRDTYLGEIKYNCTEKEWMYWDGHRWTIESTGNVKRRADEIVRQMQAELETTDKATYSTFAKHINRSGSCRSKNTFIQEASHMSEFMVCGQEFDRIPSALNVLNGTASLKTGTVKEHNRKHMLSKLAAVRYDSEATCPHWDKFLNDITCGNAILKLYLQRMVGYCMTADTSEQCMFFLYGNGGNGKSTFVDTVIKMIGEYATRCNPEIIMESNRKGDTNFILASLVKARLAVVSEPNNGCYLDENFVKQLTGGIDNKLTARFRYGRAFEFVPEFKIIMTTNYKPIIKGTDNGIWRRIRLIPFNASIEKEKQDKTLSDKLQEEMSGILNWAIAGAVGWYAEGFPPCPLIDEAMHEYYTEMDRLQQFVGDCLHIDADSSIKATTLYSVYRQWCQEQGEHYPLSNIKFYGEMRKRFEYRKMATYNEYRGVSVTARCTTMLTSVSKD